MEAVAASPVARAAVNPPTAAEVGASSAVMACRAGAWGLGDWELKRQAWKETAGQGRRPERNAPSQRRRWRRRRRPAWSPGRWRPAPRPRSARRPRWRRRWPGPCRSRSCRQWRRRSARSRRRWCRPPCQRRRRSPAAACRGGEGAGGRAQARGAEGRGEGTAFESWLRPRGQGAPLQPSAPLCRAGRRPGSAWQAAPGAGGGRGGQQEGEEQRVEAGHGGWGRGKSGQEGGEERMVHSGPAAAALRALPRQLSPAAWGAVLDRSQRFRSPNSSGKGREAAWVGGGRRPWVSPTALPRAASLPRGLAVSTQSPAQPALMM